MSADDPTPTVARDLTEALAKLARMEALAELAIRDADVDDTPGYVVDVLLAVPAMIAHLRGVLERHRESSYRVENGATYYTPRTCGCSPNFQCADRASALETVEGMAE